MKNDYLEELINELKSCHENDMDRINRCSETIDNLQKNINSRKEILNKLEGLKGSNNE